MTILKLVKETIEFADLKFISWLNDNCDLFGSIIEDELLKNMQQAKSIRWDDLIIRCEWKKEVLDKIDTRDKE